MAYQPPRDLLLTPSTSRASLTRPGEVEHPTSQFYQPFADQPSDISPYQLQSSDPHGTTVGGHMMMNGGECDAAQKHGSDAVATETIPVNPFDIPYTTFMNHVKQCSTLLARGFAFGFGFRSLFSVLIRLLTVIRTKPSTLSLDTIFSEQYLKVRVSAIRLGLFLGGYTSLFRFVYGLLTHYAPLLSTQSTAFISGSIAGLSLLAQPEDTRRSWALYVFTRAVQSIYNRYVEKQVIIPIPHGDAILFAISSSVVMFCYVLQPDALPPSFYKFIVRAGPIHEDVLRGVRATSLGLPFDSGPIKNYIRKYYGSGVDHSRPFRWLFNWQKRNGKPIPVSEFQDVTLQRTVTSPDDAQLLIATEGYQLLPPTTTISTSTTAAAGAGLLASQPPSHAHFIPLQKRGNIIDFPEHAWTQHQALAQKLSKSKQVLDQKPVFSGLLDISGALPPTTANLSSAQPLGTGVSSVSAPHSASEVYGKAVAQQMGITDHYTSSSAFIDTHSAPTPSTSLEDIHPFAETGLTTVVSNLTPGASPLTSVSASSLTGGTATPSGGMGASSSSPSSLLTPPPPGSGMLGGPLYNAEVLLRVNQQYTQQQQQRAQQARLEAEQQQQQLVDPASLFSSIQQAAGSLVSGTSTLTAGEATASAGITGDISTSTTLTAAPQSRLDEASPSMASLDLLELLKPPTEKTVMVPYVNPILGKSATQMTYNDLIHHSYRRGGVQAATGSMTSSAAKQPAQPTQQPTPPQAFKDYPFWNWAVERLKLHRKRERRLTGITVVQPSSSTATTTSGSSSVHPSSGTKSAIPPLASATPTVTATTAGGDGGTNQPSSAAPSSTAPLPEELRAGILESLLHTTFGTPIQTAATQSLLSTVKDAVNAGLGTGPDHTPADRRKRDDILLHAKNTIIAFNNQMRAALRLDGRHKHRLHPHHHGKTTVPARQAVTTTVSTKHLKPVGGGSVGGNVGGSGGGPNPPLVSPITSSLASPLISPLTHEGPPSSMAATTTTTTTNNNIPHHPIGMGLSRAITGQPTRRQILWNLITFKDDIGHGKINGASIHPDALNAIITPPHTCANSHHFIPCMALHPQIPHSCTLNFFRVLYDSTMKILPLYASLTVVPLLVFKNIRLLQHPVKYLGEAGISILRSSLFIGLFASVYNAVICAHRNIVEATINPTTGIPLLPATESKLTVIVAGLVCGMVSILCERPARRLELALFVFPKALDALLTIARSKDLLFPPLFQSYNLENILLWCFSMGIISAFFVSDSRHLSSLVYTVMKYLFAADPLAYHQYIETQSKESDEKHAEGNTVDSDGKTTTAAIDNPSSTHGTENKLPQEEESSSDTGFHHYGSAHRFHLDASPSDTSLPRLDSPHFHSPHSTPFHIPPTPPTPPHPRVSSTSTTSAVAMVGAMAATGTAAVASSLQGTPQRRSSSETIPASASFPPRYPESAQSPDRKRLSHGYLNAATMQSPLQPGTNEDPSDKGETTRQSQHPPSDGLQEQHDMTVLHGHDQHQHDLQDNDVAATPPPGDDSSVVILQHDGEFNDVNVTFLIPDHLQQDVLPLLTSDASLAASASGSISPSSSSVYLSTSSSSSPLLSPSLSR